jgi:hypothetical protein
MNLEQPCGGGGGLFAARYHFADFSLLLRRPLRTAAANSTFFAGGVQPGSVAKTPQTLVSILGVASENGQ